MTPVELQFGPVFVLTAPNTVGRGGSRTVVRRKAG